MVKLQLILLLFGFMGNIMACNPDETSLTTEQKSENEISEESEDHNENTDSIKIKLTFDTTALSATMHDNATARDFVSMLPLTLTLEDYAGIEKVSDLSRELTTSGAPSGYDPSVGDITYYAPWGNLAIFYKDYGYARGLISIGKIEGDLDVLKATSSIDVTIEKVE